MTPSDTAYSPTQDEADQENDQKHQSAGHGDGPGEKGDIYRLHVLKDEDECENTKNDPQNEFDHNFPPRVHYNRLPTIVNNICWNTTFV